MKPEELETLRKRMQRYGDDDLVEILHVPEDYVHEALELAEGELRARGYVGATVERVRQRIDQDHEPEALPAGGHTGPSTVRRMVDRAPITARLIVALLVLNVLTYALPQFINIFAFMPQRAADPHYAHTFVTYAFITSGLIYWFRSAVILLLCGQVIEQRLRRRDMIALAAGSILLGSVLLLIFSSDGGFIGPAPLEAAYMGAFLACWFKDRDTLTPSTHAGAALVALVFTMRLLSKSSFQIVMVSIGIVACVASFMRIGVQAPRQRGSNNSGSPR